MKLTSIWPLSLLAGKKTTVIEKPAPPQFGRVGWYKEQELLTRLPGMPARRTFGFIKPENGGADVYVDQADVRASGLSGLQQGQRVAFVTKQEKGNTRAINLKIVP